MNTYKAWLNAHDIPFKEIQLGLLFCYQGVNFLVGDNSGDSQYFNIMMPTIYEADASERERVLEACNRINGGRKVIKAITTRDNQVWLTAGVLIDKTSDLDYIFERLLHMLIEASADFTTKLQQC